MFPYCSSGSHDSRLEKRVRYGLLHGLLGDWGKGDGFQNLRSGGENLGPSCNVFGGEFMFWGMRVGLLEGVLGM